MSDYSPKRILCVEDDKDTCDLIKLILHYEVLTAGTIEKALSVIQSEKISLCILDNKLPDGDGTDLCRKIKEFDGTIAVVFYSGAARTSDIEEAREAGADEYLIKPLGWDKLAETVNNLLKPSNSDLILEEISA